MDSVKDSIKRAQTLLKTPDNNENYISIKIQPINGGCCCFHCWPQTWNEVNKQISHYGHLEDEGDIALGDEDYRFILECHESGPEIIIYLGVGIAVANLVKSVIDIILTIIKNRQQERIGAQFKITKRVIKNKKIIEDDVMEVDFPLSKENINLLNNKIKDIIRRDDN